MDVKIKLIKILLTFVSLAWHMPGACTEFQPGDLEQLAVALDEVQKKFDIPAMAVLLVNPDENVFFRVTGLADRKAARLADENTVFRIGSITKMFTSLAILQLAEDKLVNLQQPISTILPAGLVENRWQDAHPIRLSHLLEQTSGLPGLSKLEMDYNQALPIAQALGIEAKHRATLWPPGHHYSYSNINAGLAEFIIEKVSQQKYEDYLKSRIFLPLGMNSARLHENTATMAQLARGYDSDGHRLLPYWHMIFRGFGAINVRPVDMSPFLRLLLKRGKIGNTRIVSEKSITRMETPMSSLSARSGLLFGYALGNYSWLRNGWLFRGHGGDADGYLSRLGYNRDLNLAYFIVINAYQYDGLNAIRYLVEDFITGRRKKTPAAPYAMPISSLKALTGDYQGVTFRFGSARDDPLVANVSLKAGKLLLKIGKRNYMLIPVAAGHFRDEGESVATSAFIRDDSGKLYLQHPGGNFQRISRP